MRALIKGCELMSCKNRTLCENWGGCTYCSREYGNQNYNTIDYFKPNSLVFCGLQEICNIKGLKEKVQTLIEEGWLTKPPITSGNKTMLFESQE